MKVYTVYTNYDKYQSFMNDLTVEEIEKDLTTIYHFDGIRRVDIWKQPRGLYIANPMDEKGDFFHLSCEIAMNQKAYSVLKEIMDASCELLPFTYENETYYAINVLNVIDCYDYKKGVYDYLEDGTKSKNDIWSIKKYAFNPNNFNDKSLFKDDIFKVSTFTYEGFLPNPEKEFKYLYEKHGLKGLTFRLLWDSEKDS